MRVVVIGGTGFIGRRLCMELAASGHEIMILSRRPSKVADIFQRGVIGLGFDGKTGEGWSDALRGETAIVNLAGENIAAGRWTAARRARILQSRVDAGAAVMDAIARAETPPRVLIQGSAVGFYGPRPADEIMGEAAPAGSGFLAGVARCWEDSTAGAVELGVRRVVVRTAMVLGPGGALARMVPPFRWFLGGPVGNGGQPVSWIHLDDEVAAIRFLLEHPEAHGAYNLCAPEPTDAAEFARALGRALRRPSWLKAPAWALRLLLGQLADEVLLAGQSCRPGRLLELGFRFRHPELDQALADAWTWLRDPSTPRMAG